ncbi:tricarballylate utilization protein B, partial [Salmonella enterica subsp. enterica serovar Tennessee]
VAPRCPRSVESAEASHNALALKYLDGGHGKGCSEADEAFTLRRRRFRLLTCSGFMLCFAATIVATGYHYVAGWEAPYPFFSLPVMLGTLGGIGLLIGPAGLLWLNLRRSPLHGGARPKTLGRGLFLLLFFTSPTRPAPVAGRGTNGKGLTLAPPLGGGEGPFLTLSPPE